MSEGSTVSCGYEYGSRKGVVLAHDEVASAVCD